MSERSYDVPKGASHRGVFFHNTITVGQWIESLNIKDKVICLHYATNPHEYHAKHDAMDGIGATMNRAILDWLKQKIDRDIERGGENDSGEGRPHAAGKDDGHGNEA